MPLTPYTSLIEVAALDGPHPERLQDLERRRALQLALRLAHRSAAQRVLRGEGPSLLARGFEGSAQRDELVRPRAVRTPRGSLELAINSFGCIRSFPRVQLLGGVPGD